jgi:hypothetical protein
MNVISRRSGRPLFLGLILVVIGVIFLLEQLGNFSLQNWWALFILIPAFGSFSSAWVAYRASGRFSEGVRAGLGGGLIVFVLAFMFLFDLNWSTWWPLMVITPGLTVILNGFTLPGSSESLRPLEHRLYRPWTGWVGLSVIYLGAGFLAHNLGWLDPAVYLRNWWAIAIFLPAFGGLITALRLAAAGAGLGWASLSNLAATFIFAAIGTVALTGSNWNLILPIILIGAGLILLTGIFRRR